MYNKRRKRVEIDLVHKGGLIPQSQCSRGQLSQGRCNSETDFCWTSFDILRLYKRRIYVESDTCRNLSLIQFNHSFWQGIISTNGSHRIESKSGAILKGE